MTVYRPPGRKTFRFDFEFSGRRFAGNTKQTNEQDALLFESDLRLRLRREGGNIAAKPLSPHFSVWAATYYAFVTNVEKPKSPSSIFNETTVVLRFWGAAPEGETKSAHRPYHNLRLQDAIDEPKWIVEFEEWMTAQEWAGGTKNHFRSRLSKMFKVAMHPRYRKITGITVNPFLGLPRDRGGNRTVTLTPAQVQAWLGAMSAHAGLAVAIAALAPMLRLENILTLKWDQHVDAQLRFLTVPKHKTEAATGAPLVTPISQQLKRILAAAKKKRTSDYVISYRGKPLKSIRDGIRDAAERAGIPYGRFDDEGATFHTLRHTAATLLADTDVNAHQHRGAFGWKTLSTSEKYTHLRPHHLKSVVEKLSRKLPLERTVAGLTRRAVDRRVVGKTVGPSHESDEKTPMKPADRRETRAKRKTG